MKICKVCKIENEEQFIYCKNCGAQLELTPPPAPVAPIAPVPPVTPNTAFNSYASGQANPYAAPTPVAPQAPAGLVTVEMMLPDPANPEYCSLQTVYVTPAQKAAIQYDAIKKGIKI